MLFIYLFIYSEEANNGEQGCIWAFRADLRQQVKSSPGHFKVWLRSIEQNQEVA